jgi:glucans biosynthesis protein
MTRSFNPKQWRAVALGVGLSATGVFAQVPDFNGIKAMARELAAKPYQAPVIQLSEKLRGLNYDQLRDIRYDPREAIWRRERLPFQIQCFHPGGLQSDQLDLFLLDGDVVRELQFSPGLFNYGANPIGWEDVRGAKFSGFRVHYPLNRPDYLDELIVFQGATYFRALPRNAIYGLSARAIAIDCGSARPEIFPRFRTFWIQRPEMQGGSVTVMGLFDSPPLAGAVRFVIVPGAETAMDVSVALFAREETAQYGVAPLTSMYLFGKSGHKRFDDYRPEVHDSDGLLMQTGREEWLWRPVENEGPVRLNAFRDEHPKGFGLLQRERRFNAYEDLETEYHRRPSAWVRPKGAWGEGSVRLVELPAHTEYQDNIVAFWEPARGLSAGGAAEFAYELVWFTESAALPPLGRVVATRTGAVWGKDGARKFVIDFGWPTVAEDAAGGRLETRFRADRGEIEGLSAEFNRYEKNWRVAFDLIPAKGADTVEIKGLIARDGIPLTETWTYHWKP